MEWCIIGFIHDLTTFSANCTHHLHGILQVRQRSRTCHINDCMMTMLDPFSRRASLARPTITLEFLKYEENGRPNLTYRRMLIRPMTGTLSSFKSRSLSYNFFMRRSAKNIHLFALFNKPLLLYFYSSIVVHTTCERPRQNWVVRRI